MGFRCVEQVRLADTARVMGEVALGRDVSVWFGAVVRGDVAPISIGEGTNVQDNALVHCDSGVPNAIGSWCTIGHHALVHGKSVGDRTLIGMGAIVLGGSVIGSGCLVGAGAVVTPGMIVPDGMLVVGVPGKIVRPVNDAEREYLRWLAPHYVELAKHHVEMPHDRRIKPWYGNAAR